MSPDKKCGECEYFVRAGPDQNTGECRRHAPHPSALDPTKMFTGKDVFVPASWPKVDINCGCGEFEQKAP